MSLAWNLSPSDSACLVIYTSIIASPPRLCRVEHAVSQTKGVWGLTAPAGCRARSPTAFSRLGSRERSGRDPSRFFPFSPPMDEVHGIISISFAEVLVRCLCFPLSTYVIHAVSKNHFKPGTWAGYRKEWGLFAPKPLTRMSVGRNGVTARRYRFYKPPTLHLFASPSHCFWSLDPVSLAHRTPDTTQAGQLHSGAENGRSDTDFCRAHGNGIREITAHPHA